MLLFVEWYYFFKFWKDWNCLNNFDKNIVPVSNMYLISWRYYMTLWANIIKEEFSLQIVSFIYEYEWNVHVQCGYYRRESDVLFGPRLIWNV